MTVLRFFKPQYRMTARGNGSAEIFLYGIIGDDLFSDGITAAQFAKDLRGLGNVSNIDLRINSEGGEVFQAKTIYSLLAEHKARIVAHVDGLAASAASFVAMAADEIRMAKGAFFMLHEARGRVSGTAADHRAAADLMEAVNETMVDTYTTRTGQPRDTIVAMMAAETWLNSQQSKAAGFADVVVDGVKIAACVRRPDAFKDLPKALRPRRDQVSDFLASLEPKGKTNA